jgi:hypothetical protein
MIKLDPGIAMVLVAICFILFLLFGFNWVA